MVAGPGKIFLFSVRSRKLWSTNSENNIDVTEKARLMILEEWLKLHKGLVFKIVRAYTTSDHDDLFQEIMIQVWRSIPSFRNEAAVSTWLYRIALNTAIKWTKKEKRHPGVAFVVTSKGYRINKKRKQELQILLERLESGL